MDRCPNCGAPARPGAKFCTTCGYRLPAVAPSDPTPETGGTAAASSTDASWPSPPTAEGTESSESSGDLSTDTPQGSDEVIAMPATIPDAEANTDTNASAETELGTNAASSDSVLSSSWPSPVAEPQSDPWATTNNFGDDAGSDDDEAASGVTEEVVVVPAPASQYEGWSSAVVEDVAPAADSSGTNIARAIALLDELRLLLPALNTGTTADNEAVVAELEAVITAGNRHQAAADRQALREALRAARDNPRDIQTILALSQQADAAIALLDEHDTLVSTVQQTLAALRSQSPDDAT